MDGDDAPGQLEAPLELPNGHLEQEYAEEPERETEETRREVASGCQIAEHEEEDAAEQGRHPDMDVDRVGQPSQPLDDVRVAGMRAGRRGKRPRHDEAEAGGGEDEAGNLQLSREGEGGGAALLPQRLQRDHHGAAEREQSEEEVHDDNFGRELVTDRRQAERRLRDGQDGDADREARKPAGSRPRGPCEEDRQGDRKDPEDAVPELDELVIVGGRKEGALLTPRPALAAEARAGQADERARDDDDVERGDGRDSEPPKAERTQTASARSRNSATMARKRSGSSRYAECELSSNNTRSAFGIPRWASAARRGVHSS